MPINGFAADRIERLGKIRLGIRIPGSKDPSKTYPRATEYFVVPPEVQAVHGEKPTELPIMFPTPDVDEWLSHYYRCYSQSYGLVCIGNGIKANQKTDKSTGAIVDRETKEGNWEWREVSCEGEECPYFEKKACRGMMFLNVILPKVPGIGVYQLVTGSRNSRMNILSMINTLQKMASRVNATIDFVPFTLSLEPQTANPIGGKQKTIYVVHLRAGDLKIEDFMRLATSRSMRERLRLAAPAAQTPEEAAKEELPEDLEFPLDEPEAEPPSKGKGKAAAEKPSDKKKPERIKQVDAEKMVVDFFGHDAWDKVAVPVMKKKFNVESWDQLTAEQTLSVFTDLKAMGAVLEAERNKKPPEKPAEKDPPPPGKTERTPEEQEVYNLRWRLTELLKEKCPGQEKKWLQDNYQTGTTANMSKETLEAAIGKLTGQGQEEEQLPF